MATKLPSWFRYSLSVLLLLAASNYCLAYKDVIPRYALIIGNADYQFSPLKNPLNDANDIAGTLKLLRYQVTLGFDQKPEQLRNTVDSFYSRIKENKAVSLFIMPVMPFRLIT
ncbi:MAG: caspase family protein [Gammaproteobacteria bacterium]|nr:caspase family protein [Gammaproteobacteria bacterium]